MDGTYMGQLVAVQHRRGAKNGYKFAASLGLQLEMYSKEKTDAERQSEDDSRKVATGAELPTIPPRSTALIPPSQVKTTLMHLFDVGSPSRMTMKEKRDTFRTLQKFLAAEMSGNSFAKPMLEATAKALDQIVRSEHKANFATAMARRPSFSCALIRLLSSAYAKNSQPLALMVKVSAALSEQLRAKDDKRSPLLALLDTFQSEVGMQTGSASSTRAPGASSPSPSKRKKSDRKRKREDGESEQKHSVEYNMEKDVHVKVAEALKKRSTRPLVNEMAGLLLAEEEEDLRKKTVVRSTTSKAGLFVDWLEMLDPEMIQLDEDVKQQLLFSRYLLRVASSGKKRTMVPSSEKRPSRPYLLTMLTHQSGWKSLRSVVSRVLESHNEDLDSAAVLDFLTACVYIPKLWHGVDKHRPKHVAPTDVLNLSEDQIRVFIDYHLSEATESYAASTPEAQDTLFKGRMNLLLTCLSTREKANAAVEHLFWKIVGQGEEERKRDASQRLLLHVYMGRPSCLVQLQTGGLDSQTLLPDKVVPGMTAPTTLDVATHTILSALAATQPGRQWTSQMIDFEAAARKIAACHPLLFLRNLPLIAASLKGRTEFDFSFFRSRHHLTLYSIVMGILDLLSPHIFRPEHREGLEETLKCYFNMINAYTKRVESMEGVIGKFLTFLNDYLEADPVAASTFIRQHGRVLPDLARSLPSMAPLLAIVGSINFESLALSTSVATPPGTCYAQQARRDAASDAQRVAAALQAAKTDEELTAALKEANEACRGGAGARAAVLETLAPEIASSAAHSNAAVRNQAHNLLLKCMRFSPRPSVTRDLASAFVRCLESSDSSVTQSALEKLPDVVVLAQESLVDILSAVFNLGIHGGFNVTQYVADTINVLNSSLGY